MIIAKLAAQKIHQGAESRAVFEVNAAQSESRAIANNRRRRHGVIGRAAHLPLSVMSALFQ